MTCWGTIWHSALVIRKANRWGHEKKLKPPKRYIYLANDNDGAEPWRKWTFYTKLISEDVIEIVRRKDSQQNDKNSENECSGVPAVEIVSVVVVIILVPTEEMKQGFVKATTMYFSLANAHNRTER